MTPAEIIENTVGRKLSDREINFLLYERTAFPVGDTTAKEIYKAVNGFDRAVKKGLQLCTFCDRIAENGEYECSKCNDALKIT